MDRFDFQADGEGRFRVRGKLNFESVPSALDESLRLFASHDRIELDFSDAEATDSAGLALLVEWVSWARREHRQLHFRHVPKQLVSLARISDVQAMLPVA